jgi:hypothetical protein
VRNGERIHIAFVTNEPIDPPSTGGRLRMHHLYRVLHSLGDVEVVVPSVKPPRTTPLAHLGTGPRLAVATWGWQARRRIARRLECSDPDLVVFSHSYLASWTSDWRDVPHVVDFPNDEGARYLSIAGARRPAVRQLWRLEELKSRRWENRVIRSANLCTAVDAKDAQSLAMRRGRSMVLANPLPRVTYAAAQVPDIHRLGILANMAYGPNLDSALTFLRRDWPLILGQAPGATLAIAGRGTSRHEHLLSAPGVRVLGELDDLSQFYATVGAVLAPVSSGAGTQTKVIEALGAGLLVVGHQYGLRSAESVGLDVGYLSYRSSEELLELYRTQSPAGLASRSRKLAVSLQAAVDRQEAEEAALLDALRSLVRGPA